MRQLENKISSTAERRRSFMHLLMPQTMNSVQFINGAAEATGAYQEIIDKHLWKKD